LTIFLTGESISSSTYIFGIFSRKARKLFTLRFWRKRFTREFWSKRFRISFWEHRIRQWWDELAGLDFLEDIRPEDLGLDPELMYESAPSGNQYLRRVLKSLQISSSDAIIDIGSGKGSAMRTMLAFPFSRVDGVEISPKVVQIARRNFEKLNVPAGRCTVFEMDATKFVDLDIYNHFYFYSPFSSGLMADVIANILESVSRKPRRVKIIYTNPEYEFVLKSTRELDKVGDHPGAYDHRIVVYSNSVDPT
jgi:predicted RNA methylase